MGPEGGARDFLAAGEEELEQTEEARVKSAAVLCGEMAYG